MFEAMHGRATAGEPERRAAPPSRDDVDSADAPLFTADDYFTKPPVTDLPPWLDCSVDGNPASCSTIEYKGQTRQHIEEDLGLNIVGNFGDQFSDLLGGFADTTYKLPNPTYYLP